MSQPESSDELLALRNQVFGLTQQIAQRDERLEQYRELVGRLALAKDKVDCWFRAQELCPFWRELGFDLKTKEQQRAFLFGL